MAPPMSCTVDVREMLCAQALAHVAQAVERLSVGASCKILSNAEDVQRDIITWMQAKGHRIKARAPEYVLVERSV